MIATPHRNLSGVDYGPSKARWHPVDRQELESLNRLAHSVVVGLPIDASVEYDERSARLTVRCRSRRPPLAAWHTTRPSVYKEESSPMVDDYFDLNAYVKERVAAFVRHWIRGD
jgi:hypothetical protein